MSIQVLLTADNHLDPRAAMFGAREYERKSDYMRCFKATVDFALENKPDIFLICGDLFDNIRPRNPPRTVLMRWFRALSEKGVKVFAISGHHDTPKGLEEGGSPLAVYGDSGYVTFYQDTSRAMNSCHKISGEDVCISGISYNPSMPLGADPLSGMGIAPQGDINILMLHYPIESFRGYYPNEPVARISSLPKGFQLIAAGHLHAHQRSNIRGLEVVYPGSTERRSFLEEGDDKGFVWMELDKSGVISAEFVKTPSREMRTVEFNLPHEGNLNEILKEELIRLKDPECVLRVKLLGSVSVDLLSTYRRPELISFASDKFFAIVFEEKGMEIQAPGEIEALPRTTPLQELHRYFEKRITEAKEGERAYLDQALKLCETMLREAGAW